MKLTREEAIRLHREMWNFIAEEEAKLGTDCRISIDRRSELKEVFLRRKGISPDDILNNCFLCEYTIQSADSYGHCEYCPLDWGSTADTQCEDEISENSIVWFESPAAIIANLSERDLDTHHEL